jgi:hypothetical protein
VGAAPVVVVGVEVEEEEDLIDSLPLETVYYRFVHATSH